MTMWFRFRAAVFVLVVISLFGMSSVVYGQRSYEFPHLLIEAEIKEDGTVKIQEFRTAAFEGRYTGLFQWINLERGMEITDVQVGEPGRPYEYNPAHDIGPSGTYFAERRGNQMYIDWSFEAADEVRTFVVSYTVHNAVLAHDDVAEFYYQFVGSEWEKGVKEAEVILRLPPGAAQDEIRAWGHGPLHGVVEIVDEQTVRWTVERLPAETMLEGRVTFPLSLVPQATRRTGEEALPQILAEEERWAEEANRRRQAARLDIASAIAVGLAAVIAPIVLWSRYGRPHKTDFEGEYYRELPADYTPAELGVLWNSGSVTTKDFTATLLDLARRRVISITEEVRESKKVFKKRTEADYVFTKLEHAETLKLHEEILLEFLFDEAAGGDEQIKLSEIEQFARRKKRAFAQFWKDWQEEVKLVAEEHNFFESHNSARGFAVLLGVGCFFLAMIAFVTSWMFSGIALIAASIILTITGAVLRRRSVQGENDYVRWKAFRKFLQHFSELERHEVPSLIIWEHYLVYAVTLGVAEQVIKQLEIVFPNLEDQNYRFGYGWYYYHLGTANSLNQGLTNMTSKIEQSFTQSIQMAVGQSASGAGMGGGFSGGGGGGFGGGGGGAR